MSEAEKIIYSMYKVSKHYEKTEIIGDISLSYFYGAKIGVLGLNGSGKSTLLRIMAGVDADYEGEISIQPGFTVGYLEQEPELEQESELKLELLLERQQHLQLEMKLELDLKLKPKSELQLEVKLES